MRSLFHILEFPMHRIVLLIVLLILTPLARATESAHWEAEEMERRGAAKDLLAIEGATGSYVLLAEKQMDPAKPPNASVSATYSVTAPGIYRISARVYAPDEGSDSFTIWVDDEQIRAAGVRRLKEWVWLSAEFLAKKPGPRRITIGAREPTRVDAVKVIPRVTSDRPQMRQDRPFRPEPNPMRAIDVNPPTFRWLGEPGKEFEIELRPEKANWNEARKIDAGPRTFWRALKPLAVGRYAWRVRAKGGKEWLGPETFDVTAETAKWEIEPWDKVFARFPKERPRIFFGPGDIPTLRARLDGPLKPLTTEWVAWLEKNRVDKPLPDVVNADVDGFDERQAKVVKMVNARADISKICDRATDEAFLARVLERDDLARDAIRRVVASARLDPKGPSSARNTDFGNGLIVRSAASVYDYLHDHLTPEEKRTIRELIEARMFEYKPWVEQNLYKTHCWQWVILDYARGGLAIWDESPKAREWLEWAARMFVAHYPWFGGADGGSAEGMQYYAGTNVHSAVDMARFWRHACGIDLAKGPWYRNTPYYFLYGHPPGGPKSEFGDRYPFYSMTPNVPKIVAARQLANLTGNRYAEAFARWGLGVHEPRHVRHRLVTYRDLAFAWALWGAEAEVEPRPLGDLPPGRAFYDVGHAMIHSDYDDTSNNVFFEMRSSPYGSFAHAHADQNSFNLAAYGGEVICDSGYYFSYGDDHHYGWTAHAKAHNTILMDGGDPPWRHLMAYGRIAGFEQGEGWAWTAGDASEAYGNDPGLKRFIRQAVWLGEEGLNAPQTFVVFDSIRGRDGEPHRWDYLLHFWNKPRIDEAKQHLRVAGWKAGRADVTWLAPQGLEYSLTDQFDPPVEQWRPDLRKSADEFPNQWHLTASPKEKSPEQHFLVVMQTSRIGNPMTQPEVRRMSDCEVAIGDRRVRFTDTGVRIEVGGKVVLEKDVGRAD